MQRNSSIAPDKHTDNFLTLKDRLTGVIIGIGIALLAIPIAVIATFILVPFWSWLEKTSNLESIGHSGPAEWCYLLIYLFVISIGGLIWTMRKKKQISNHQRDV